MSLVYFCRMRLTALCILLSGLSACGILVKKNPPVPLPVVKPPQAVQGLTRLPEFNASTLLIYEVKSGGQSYQFIVQVTDRGEWGTRFNFMLTTEDRPTGSYTMDATALEASRMQSNYFRQEDYMFEDVTSIWFSKLSYSELIQGGKTNIELVKPGVEEGDYIRDGIAALVLTKADTSYRCEYNHTVSDLKVHKAGGLYKGKPVTYILNADADNPFIVYMNIGFEVSLKEVYHLEAMPDPFRLNKGSFLKYVYTHIDSVAPEMYDFVDDTLLLKVSEFNPDGVFGVFALYSHAVSSPKQQGVFRVNFKGSDAGKISFRTDPWGYCSGRPNDFNGACEGWFMNQKTLGDLIGSGNRATFSLNSFHDFHAYKLVENDNRNFAWRREVSVNGESVDFYAYRISRGNLSTEYIEFLPCAQNPIVTTWDDSGAKRLYLHSVLNP
jgi:hypothetical protein